MDRSRASECTFCNASHARSLPGICVLIHQFNRNKQSGDGVRDLRPLGATYCSQPTYHSDIAFPTVPCVNAPHHPFSRGTGFQQPAHKSWSFTKNCFSASGFSLVLGGLQKLNLQQAWSQVFITRYEHLSPFSVMSLGGKILAFCVLGQGREGNGKSLVQCVSSFSFIRWTHSKPGLTPLCLYFTSPFCVLEKLSVDFTFRVSYHKEI